MFSASKTAGPSGYNIANSLRFRSSASAYLSRTPSIAGNRQTWTWSGWIKRGALGITQVLFEATDATGTTVRATNRFTPGDLFDGTDSSSGLAYTTTQVFRDPSAWYHIVVAMDTTQAVAANRFKLYINGAQVTSFSSITYPTLNASTLFNSTSYFNYIGATRPAFSQYFDGYLAEVNFIDGQALTPSSFGEIDAVTGVWKAKRYAGTYGTNGFKLNFSNGTSTTTLGYDSSGNGNNWTTNNISLTAGSTYDWMIDSPTSFAGTSYGVGNYAVLNPLNVVSATISGGNLNSSVGATQGYMVGTMGLPSSGKYYFEVINGSAASGGQVSIGLEVSQSPPVSFASATAYTLYLGYGSGTANLYINNNGTNSGANVVIPITNDILYAAYDAGTGKLWLGYNGNWKNSSGVTDASANPATGTNPTLTITAGLSLVPFHHVYSNSASINFGQRPFAYTPPSGYKSLCTQNLPVATIYNGANFMAATLYTGTNANQSISNSVNGVSFQPDFVWVKSRSGAFNHALLDSIRGVTKGLASNSTAAETTSLSGYDLTAFNANGFTLGPANIVYVNNNGYTYVGWQWKAGGTAVTNTAGSITSQVSANTTAGFSVVTYTGTGSAATVGHGLGVAPSMVFIKARSLAGENWIVGHASLPSAFSSQLNLNSTAAYAASSNFNSTNPTASVFSIGSGTAVNSNTNTYVAYCFAAIPGYSAFGSYTGNGSTNGPFVYCGFRPRWVMFKLTSGAENWYCQDSSRGTYNANTYELFPNLSNAEQNSASYSVDFLSNGFKLRTSDTSINASGGTYIYAAFAESPFQNALAR